MEHTYKGHTILMRLIQRSRRGQVTLTCSRSDFASLLLDAAKSMTGTCEPLRDDLLRMAEEFAAHEAVHNPDSSDVYLFHDVKQVLGVPLTLAATRDEDLKNPAAWPKQMPMRPASRPPTLY